MDDERTRRRLEVHFAIRNVLRYEWDPIGIGDEPVAEDEYDSYIDDVLSHLVSNSSAETIASYLHDIETKRMWINRTSREEAMSRLLPVAEKLKQIDIRVPPCD